MINYQQKLINYFFEYLQFNTQSNETVKAIPSTSGQMELARYIDGGPFGEFGYETFNAASAEITIQGISMHPGSGKDKLVNPILIANDLINQFDPLNTPEHSEGREVFWIHREGIDKKPMTYYNNLRIEEI